LRSAPAATAPGQNTTLPSGDARRSSRRPPFKTPPRVPLLWTLVVVAPAAATTTSGLIDLLGDAPAARSAEAFDVDFDPRGGAAPSDGTPVGRMHQSPPACQWAQRPSLVRRFWRVCGGREPCSTRGRKQRLCCLYVCVRRPLSTALVHASAAAAAQAHVCLHVC
jgi:hypothetical protein